MDQHTAAYLLDRKSSVRFYLCIFFDLMGIAFVNSYLIYNMKHSNELSLLDYKIVVAKNLIQFSSTYNISFIYIYIYIYIYILYIYLYIYMYIYIYILYIYYGIYMYIYIQLYSVFCVLNVQKFSKRCNFLLAVIKIILTNQLMLCLFCHFNLKIRNEKEKRSSQVKKNFLWV